MSITKLDPDLRNDLKNNLRKSIKDYVLKFKYNTVHPLDLLIPTERKVRSVVGGLETSIGTTVWEPVAKTLAKTNGFEIIEEKFLMPSPMPIELAQELSKIISLRESKSTWIDASECIARLKNVCNRIDRSSLEYIAPPAGTGVDILIRKNNKYFAYDTKTVQPNLGSVKGFNKQILEWYAYAICKNPDIDLSCSIAYPYNPYRTNFWNRAPHNKGVLQPSVDALLENEFWDFLSGLTGTYQMITEILSELNTEGFGSELSTIIEKINH